MCRRPEKVSAAYELLMKMGLKTQISSARLKTHCSICPAMAPPARWRCAAERLNVRVSDDSYGILKIPSPNS